MRDYKGWVESRILQCLTSIAHCFKLTTTTPKFFKNNAEEMIVSVSKKKINKMQAIFTIKRGFIPRASLAHQHAVAGLQSDGHNLESGVRA